MVGDRAARVMPGMAVAVVLGGCASIMGSSESVVEIRTSPDGAQCRLAGYGGFEAQVTTPASLSVPTAASPVTVTCSAAGRRPASYTLQAGSDGWIWGNSALFLASGGGVAVLGALVDQSRSAGKAYAPEVHYDLPPDRPRAVRAVSRDGSADVRATAR